jgi:hypothetical protein
MLIEIKIGGSQLTCVEVVRAINHSRLNADDHTPFAPGETGIFRDTNGNQIGTWKTTETDFPDE